jgi:beta-glucosidase
VVGNGAGRSYANDIDHVQLTTRLRVPKSGRYSVGTSGLGEFRLVVDGAVMFDETIGLPLGADIVEAIMKPPQQLTVVDLEAWADVPVELTYRPTSSGAALGGAEVTMLTWTVEPGIYQLHSGRSVVDLPLSSEISRG